MRYIVFVVTLVISLVGCSGQTVTMAPTVLEKPDPNAKYLFYLHGRDVDKGSPGAKEAYRRNVQALSKRGFVVLSEARPKGTIKKIPLDLEKYAQKVADEVNKLLAHGVSAGNIIVSGYSRGGAIALIASGLIDNIDVKFIIMAGCVAVDGAHKLFVPTVRKKYSPKLKGRFLSLHDAGDEDFGSCADYFGIASGKVDYNEITLSTGKGHITFREPMDEWLKPIVEWTGVKQSKK